MRVALAGLYFPAMRRTSYEQMNCSIASALDVVGEPWTLLIVRDAFYGVRRFDDFQENLGIARNVLTARLKARRGRHLPQDRLPPASAAPRIPPDRQGCRAVHRHRRAEAVGRPLGAAARSGKPMDLVNRGDGRPLEPVLIDRRLRPAAGAHQRARRRRSRCRPGHARSSSARRSTGLGADSFVTVASRVATGPNRAGEPALKAMLAVGSAAKEWRDRPDDPPDGPLYGAPKVAKTKLADDNRRFDVCSYFGYNDGLSRASPRCRSMHR